MPEVLLHDFRVQSLVDEYRGTSVSQVVDSGAFKVSASERGDQTRCRKFDNRSGSRRGDPNTRASDASGDRVVVEGSNSGTVLSTAKRYDHDWVMVLTLRDAEVVAFRHFYDPADIESAM
jgi:ketosteroid isomerase-like protein